MAQNGLLHSVHDDEESIMDYFVVVAPRNDREMKNGGAFPAIASPLGRGNPYSTGGS